MTQNKQQELLSRLRPMVQQPGIDEMCQLLKVTIELWKEELVDAKDEDVLQLQGAIKRTRILLTDLTRTVPKQAYRNGAYTGEGD